MKRAVLSVAILLFLSPPTFPQQLTGNVEVYFSPNGGATGAIVREIGRARKKVLVQAYSFTSFPIAKAIVVAKRRGVEVTVVLDRETLKRKYPRRFFESAGIPVYIDAKHAIAHNKVIVIDDSTLITGSFNFTKAAEYENAENLLVIKDDPALTDKYLKNFYEHLSHSERP